MSAGTITLTNKSAVVSGNGTSFTTEVAAGDFIVVTVGGIPYTLQVNTVNSNTSATLVSNFTGPTQSGAAWSAVPRIAMNLVTAALVAQSAEALRGLNYDKQNWQQVFSASGMITVKLPDGSTFPGPSWKYLSDNMATKSGGAVPVDQGGTGSTTPYGGRNNLGLGSGDNVAFYRLNLSGPTRPQLNMQATSRTDIGAILRVEVPPESGTSPYFTQLASLSGAEGTILNFLPRTSGTLAVQGTSGREFKTDITPADNKEALSRVMSLEMVNFVYKDDEQQRLRFGIIAEDAEIHAPQYVKHYRYPVHGTEVFDDEGNIVSQEYEDRPAIDNNPIIMDLLGVAQYQQKMINDMAESIKTLESRLT